MSCYQKVKFRSFIVKLAKEITEETFKELKYVLRGDILGEAVLEKLKQPLDLFQKLEKCGIIDPQDLSGLRELLCQIHERDLVSMVDDFERSSGLLSSKIIAKPESENYLTMDGYYLKIEDRQHFEVDGVGEFVELRSGESYAISIRNENFHRSRCKIKVDGHVVFPSFIVYPQQTVTIKRPSNRSSKLKFFAIEHAPPESGIDKKREHLNGLVEVKFIPEREDIQIKCYYGNVKLFSLICSNETTATSFHDMISFACQSEFGFEVPMAISVYFGFKPIGQLNHKLTEFGIRDGSRVDINIGIVGGGLHFSPPDDSESKKIQPRSRNWIAGATTLQGESKQTFGSVGDFIPDKEEPVTLRLRLVARADESPVPSNQVCTPLARETPTPPPIGKW